MIQIPIPQIPETETEKFSKQWTYNGVAVTLDNTTIKFATDWANVLLKQYAGFLGQVLTAVPQAQKEIEPLEPKLIVE